MNDQEKRKQIKRYFRARHIRSGFYVFLILLAVVVFVFGSAGRNTGPLPVISLGIFLIGLLGVIITAGQRGGIPSDADIDRWLQEDIDNLKKTTVLKRIGLVMEQINREPLVVIGPIYWMRPGIDKGELEWRKGKDGIVRFSAYNIAVIFLADHLLAAYLCDFNFLRNVALNEKTDEFFYRDIVSVSTQQVSSNYTLPVGQKLVWTQNFRISVSSGDQFEIIINSEELKSITKGELPDSNVDAVIQAIRAKLREKKEPAIV